VKKIFVVVFALIVAVMVMTACTNKTSQENVVDIPQKNIISMFSAQAVLYYPEGRNAWFMEYNKDYFEVIVDGELIHLIDPEENSYVILGKKAPDGMIQFDSPIPLLDFRDVTVRDGISGHRVFYSGYDTLHEENMTLGMVIIDGEDMPDFVSARLWDATVTKLCVWQYPQESLVIQNLVTDEVTHVYDEVDILAGDGTVLDRVEQGECVSGLVIAEDDRKISIVVE